MTLPTENSFFMMNIRTCCAEGFDMESMKELVSENHLKNSIASGKEFNKAIDQMEKGLLKDTCRKFPLQKLLNEYIVDDEQVAKNDAELHLEAHLYLSLIHI